MGKVNSKTRTKVLAFLEDFGLSDIESDLYMGLLETGPNTVLGISKHTGIKRTTAHVNIENLIEKGLVAQTQKGSRRKILAEPPSKLKYILEQEKAEIEELESKLDSVKDILEETLPEVSEKTDVTVKYYEGKENVMSVYLESMEADKVHSFASLKKYYQVFPDTLDLWEEALEKNKKREVWDILVESDIDKKIGESNEYDRYHVKFLPSTNIFSGFDFADYIMFDDKVAIIELDPDKPVATVIRSKDMAMSLMALHRTMWQLLP